MILTKMRRFGPVLVATPFDGCCIAPVVPGDISFDLASWPDAAGLSELDDESAAMAGAAARTAIEAARRILRMNGVSLRMSFDAWSISPCVSSDRETIAE